MSTAMKKWKLLHRIVHLQSPWITVYADKLLDNHGRELEYWHFVRANSVIVIALHGGDFVVPPMEYRPGVQQVTLDFAGGRIGQDQTPRQAALAILDKELGVGAEQLSGLVPINREPFAVDSSFSSQQVYGFVATINPAEALSGKELRFATNDSDKLKQQLHCAQCRLLLNEFLLASN